MRLWHWTAAACALCAPPVFAAEITVSAAASLKEAFGELVRGYEQRYPDAKVKLNTAASGVLLRQLAQGAPVDVLATADEATMDKAAAQQLIRSSERKTFAHNALVLVVSKRSRYLPKSLNDLRRPEIARIAIGNPASVPAGAYARSALLRAGVFEQLSGKYVYTQNVRQALDYVARGEVDAGFVYRTDARLQGDKLLIALTVPTAEPVSYAVAPTAASRQSEEAKRFCAYLLSSQGRAVLQQYGFAP